MSDYFERGYNKLLQRGELFQGSTSLLSVGNPIINSVDPALFESGDIGQILRLARNGYIIGGAVDYNSGKGFYLGYRPANNDYGFFLGDSAGDKMTYNTTDNVLTLTGALTISSGSIAGLTITSSALTAVSGGNTTIISSGATAFTAGPTGSPTFTVTQAGLMTSTSALIAAWSIGTTTISSTGVTLTSGSSASIAFGTTVPTSPTSGTGIYIDKTGLFGLLSNTQKFKIDATTGTITATAAVIDGTSTLGGRLGSTLASAINSSANLITDIINARLDSSAKTMLSDFSFGAADYAGALKSGTITWNTTTGAITGGSGVLVYRGGIIGASAGVATITLDAATGNATFAGTLSAPSGTLGTITAGTITGATVQTATSGARVVFDSNGIKQFDATTQRSQLLNDGSGWLGASTTFAWTTAGVVTAGGFTFSANTLANSTNIILDGTNKAISISDATFGNTGIQLQYNAGTPRAHFGTTTKYLQFDGTNAKVNGVVMDATSTINGSTALNVQNRAETLFADDVAYIGNVYDSQIALVELFTEGVGAGSVTRYILQTRFIDATNDNWTFLRSNQGLGNTIDDGAIGWDDKDMDFYITAEFSDSTNQDAFLGYGGYGGTNPANNATDTTRHIGFYFQDGIINASNADGTTQTKTDVSSGITMTNMNLYWFTFDTGTNIKYYINDTLVATHTTNLPGSGGAAFFYVGIQGVGANLRSMDIKNNYILVQREP